MENTIIEYSRKLDDLEKYVEELAEINAMLSGNYIEELSKKVQKMNREPSKRVFDYNLIIITTYGILEGFIEQIIMKYLEEVNDIINEYSNLPKEIKDNHLILSAELIINSQKLAKYNDVQKDDVVRNLWSCIDNESPKYVLNGRAFTHHSSNFRKDVIREMFKNIGICNITSGVTKDDEFKSCVATLKGIELEDLKGYDENSYYIILHDIVERRNDIAHGNDSDDILSLEMLKGYIYYIKQLIRSIYNVLSKQMKLLQIENGKTIMLGKPIRVFNNTIIGISNNFNELKTGMVIFSKNTANEEIKVGKILSIEVNHEKRESVGKDENIPVGIKVDFKAKDNHEFGVLI